MRLEAAEEGGRLETGGGEEVMPELMRLGDLLRTGEEGKRKQVSGTTWIFPSCRQMGETADPCKTLNVLGSNVTHTPPV